MAAEAMDDLGDRFADRAVRSVFVYTREAHPGEHYGHHRSMDDKRRHAAAFLDECRVRREILLDDLAGTAHRAYGMLPNMTWIVGRGGFIHYKSTWTSVPDIAGALQAVVDFQANRAARGWVPFYTERSAWSTRDPEAFQQRLLRAGPQAVTDFERMLHVHSHARQAPSEDIGPRGAGNFYKTEDEA